MPRRSDLTNALARIKLPRPARQRLERVLLSASPSVIPGVEAQTAAHEARVSLDDLMLKLLPVAKEFAVAPISNFHVGAVSRGKSGSLYFGANMEFPGQALSFCTHAEQSATMNAFIHQERGVTALAVTDAPCGYCRQFLYELVTANILEILLPGRPKILLSRLLPEAFGPRDLGVRGGMMQAADNGLHLDHNSANSTVKAALAAANRSYAPYTGGYAGVALSTRAGQVFAAPYAENAAYNPSISPMEAALSQSNLNCIPYAEITGAALVQARPAKSSQVDASTAVLKAVSTVRLEVAYARSSQLARRQSPRRERGIFRLAQFLDD
jgi:cytidine deaminase